MIRAIKETYRFIRLLWRWRHLQVASLTQYAEVSVGASDLVDKIREMNPPRNFLWSFSTNHSTDVYGTYICLWEVHRRPTKSSTLEFIYHGPLCVLKNKMEQGKMDEIVGYIHPVNYKNY